MKELKFKIRGKDYEILNHMAYLNGLEVSKVIQGLNNFAQSSRHIANPVFKKDFNNKKSSRIVSFSLFGRNHSFAACFLVP